LNNTITSNEITKLFVWFSKEFPDFDKHGRQNTLERWYTVLQGMTKKDIGRGCMAARKMRKNANPDRPMTVPPNLELFSRMCRTT